MISAAAQEALELKGAVFHVSAISAWEIGMLVAKGRLNLTRSPIDWFDSFSDGSGGERFGSHATDPGRCIFPPGADPQRPRRPNFVATAREHDLTIITRDRAVLAYGAAGHVKVLAC